MHRRLLALPLLGLAVMSGCSAGPALLPTSLPAASSQATRTLTPTLNGNLIQVLTVGGHEAKVVGSARAATGHGVWASEGTHQQPAPGDEAPIAADGSFAVALHAHPGDQITVWAFVDAGDKRTYSAPLQLVNQRGRWTVRSPLTR
jgi:hypothetical protein